jgi:hypothetical protein
MEKTDNEKQDDYFSCENVFEFYRKKNSTTKELVTVFEALSYNETYESIKNTTNWFFAMSVAVLLWFLGNFDKFVIKGVFVNK